MAMKYEKGILATHKLLGKCLILGYIEPLPMGTPMIDRLYRPDSGYIIRVADGRVLSGIGETELLPLEG